MDKNFCVSLPDGASYDAHVDENLLVAAQRVHWLVRYGCRNGNCDACTAKLISGCVQHRDGAIIDAPAEKILLCLCQPLSDIVIDLPIDPRPGSMGQSLRSYAQLHRQDISDNESILYFTLPAGRKPVLLDDQIALIETDLGLLQGSIDHEHSRDRELVVKLIFESPLQQSTYYHIRYPLNGNRPQDHRDD